MHEIPKGQLAQFARDQKLNSEEIVQLARALVHGSGSAKSQELTEEHEKGES